MHKETFIVIGLNELSDLVKEHLDENFELDEWYEGDEHSYYIDTTEVYDDFDVYCCLCRLAAKKVIDTGYYLVYN